ncbi:MAG: hypothetical protein H0W76_14475 [Pyrinomonadaceae bacterium]|nr:hypothetical protein [Pyrinomonadaceae bacterium]
MKRYITRHVLLAKLAALALLTLCFMQISVRAQYGNPRTYQIISAGTDGLARGQTLRFTLFNPNVAGLQDEHETVRAQAKLSDERGNVIAESDEVAIPAGEFRSFDFHRNDIPLAGEAGTGRLQLRASCYVRVAVPEKKLDGFVASVEIIEDGLSSTLLVAESLPSHDGGDGNDFLNSGFGNNIVLGIVPGQTLRLSLFNPPSSGSETQRHPISAHVKVFDYGGNLLAQSPELVIPPSEFRSFNFSRAALPPAGEPGTGRLQVRVRLELSGSPKATALLVPSLEIIDNSTGRTTARIRSTNNLKQIALAAL